MKSFPSWFAFIVYIGAFVVLTYYLGNRGSLQLHVGFNAETRAVLVPGLHLGFNAEARPNRLNDVPFVEMGGAFELGAGDFDWRSGRVASIYAYTPADPGGDRLVPASLTDGQCRILVANTLADYNITLRHMRQRLRYAGVDRQGGCQIVLP